MENTEKKRTLYTEEGYKVLVDELEYLKTTKMKQIKENLAEARSFGDLSENSEYDEAKNEQTKVVTRIQELEELLNNAEVIKESEMRADIIHLGAKVKLLDLDENEELEYSIVGTNEANPFVGKISDQSPIGSALLGAKIGDEITAEIPNGTLRFRILEVSRDKN